MNRKKIKTHWAAWFNSLPASKQNVVVVGGSVAVLLVFVIVLVKVI